MLTVFMAFCIMVHGCSPSAMCREAARPLAAPGIVSPGRGLLPAHPIVARRSVGQFVGRSVCRSVCLSVCLSDGLSVGPSVGLSVGLSVCRLVGSCDRPSRTAPARVVAPVPAVRHETHFRAA